MNELDDVFETFAAMQSTLQHTLQVLKLDGKEDIPDGFQHFSEALAPIWPWQQVMKDHGDDVRHSCADLDHEAQRYMGFEFGVHIPKNFNAGTMGTFCSNTEYVQNQNFCVDKVYPDEETKKPCAWQETCYPPEAVPYDRRACNHHEGGRRRHFYGANNLPGELQQNGTYGQSPITWHGCSHGGLCEPGNWKMICRRRSVCLDKSNCSIILNDNQWQTTDLIYDLTPFEL